MTRIYTAYAENDEVIKGFLNQLIDDSTFPEDYRKVNNQLGHCLGQLLINQYSGENIELYIACTVEDADFLAKGIIDVAESSGKFGTVKLACFWNERVNLWGQPEMSVAPIKKRYREPSSGECDQVLVIVKSIISSACVVKTNLTNLINEMNPQRIAIVAPVMLEGAEEKLEQEFESTIVQRFEYYAYAKDDQKDDIGNVLPGIGGNVYERLGLGSQDEKNKRIPDIVKRRRSSLNLVV